MKHQYHKSLSRNSGVTLIELLVALFLSSLVIGLVFYAWVGIIKHNGRSERRAILVNETRRILGTISADIGRSPKIVYLARDEVRFVSAISGDTNIYRYAGEVILKNGVRLSTISDSGLIRHFAITKASSNNPQAQQILVKLDITMGNASGDTSSLQSQVTIQAPEEASSSVE
jgi:prepilin-type N-terminal cleavage/methylation domain-containing protein